MEDYYHKVIKLQEMLRKSEEERLNLEIKFNETLQLIKQEEEVHLKRFRSKYRKFLDEDKRRQQRNYKILEALDRIENRTSMWETKTEKFRAMKKKYQSCINLPGSTKYDQDFKEISKPIDYSVAEKNIVIDKYMDDFSPKNYHSDNEKPIDNSSFLNKYSNLGNINSLYSKFSHHEKTDPEKVETFDPTPLKTTKDYANILKQNSDSQDYPFSKRWNQNDTLEKPLTFSRNEGDNLRSNYFPDVEPLLKAPQTIIRLSQPEERELVKNSFQESEIVKNWNEDEKPSAKYNEERPLLKEDYDATFSNREDFVGKITNDELLIENSGIHQLVKSEEEEQNKQPSQEYEKKEYEQDENVQQFNMTADLQKCDSVRQPLQMNADRNEKVLSQSHDYPQVTDIKRQLSQSNIENQRVLNEEISVKNEQEHGNEKFRQSVERNEENWEPIPHNDGYKAPTQQYEEKFEPQKDGSGQPIQRCDENEQPIQESERIENLIGQQEENENLTRPYEEGEQPVQQYDENVQQHDENKQPYNEQQEGNEQQYVKNEPPIQQNGANGQPYHEQYDNDGKPIQQYDANDQPYPQQYDENGQPIQQYDANGHQPYPQQYDENGQPIQPYDANAQPYQQYDGNGQPVQQFDENGKPIQQYDASGQPYPQQYDENGQPIQQYDENGQPILQYDTNAQPYHQQYDESGQPIQQYDENGQPIQQFDANGQPYQQQYDENGQPIQQYDASGQPYHQQFDENGQPIPQYDENGQPYPQYDENGQVLQYYDENGQPVQQYGQYMQQYDENGQPLQYDENGQFLQQLAESTSGEPVQPHDADKQILQDEQEKDQPKSNVLDILETDTESLKIESKVSNDSDFDISNASKN